MRKKKVVLIGWDAADWQIIRPLLDEGKMPALKKFISDGVHGNVSTMNPPYSPMLWTSVATGKTPDKHGVLGFIEIDSDAQLVRPVTVTKRKTRAIWNILHNAGLKSNIVGWWPSHPAEPINGTIVSDLFPKPLAKIDEAWPLADGCIYPKSMVEQLKELRVHPQELTGAHLVPFIPKASEIEDEDQKSLQILSKIISHNASLHACSTWLMENTDWDFTAIYYDMIDHFCHAFMKYHPPKLPAIPDKIFEIYKDAVRGSYMFQDMMLERTLELAGEDALVIVMSDHGYVSDNNRLLVPPKFHAGPAIEHREFGIFAMKGPGVKKDEKIYGTSLLDITPTILNYLGLPIGKDMDGRAMLDAFENVPEPKEIESWDKEQGDFGEHHDSVSGDAFSQQAAMEQLIELGYIDRPDEDVEKAIEKTKWDLQFNLARVYMGKRDFAACEKILFELMDNGTDKTSYLVDLIHVSIIQEKFAEAKKYLVELRELDPKAKEKTKLAEAKILFGEGKAKKGKEILEELSTRERMVGATHYEMGKLYMRLQDYNLAVEHFLKAVDFNEDHAKYQHALAVAYLRNDKADEALDHALKSIELVRYFPDAHYTVGEALEKLGEPEAAKLAFATAEKLRPKMKRATMARQNIEKKTGQVNSADNVADFPEIVIVSGLPRSGTSMMMQMINAGGVEALTDEVRKKDVDNPKGYYEYEKTKGIQKDNSWLGEAEGKVLKVVAQLLKFLPLDFRYKVIFMTRDLDEVLASQKVMLKNKKALPKEGVRASFENELQKLDVWCEKEPGVEVLKVAYADVVDNAAEQAKIIQDFLGREMDVDNMVAQVESNLYRNRILKF